MTKSPEEKIEEMQAYIDMLHGVLDNRFSEMVTDILLKDFDSMIDDCLSDAYGETKSDIDSVAKDLYNLDDRVSSVEDVVNVTITDQDHNITLILDDMDKLRQSIERIDSSIDELYGIVKNESQ